MVSLQYIDHLDTNPSTSEESFETYTLLNLKLSYRLLKQSEIFVSSENIMNQKYNNNIYYPLPGTTLFGGLKLRF